MLNRTRRLLVGTLAVAAVGLGASAVSTAASSTSSTSNTTSTNSSRPMPPAFHGPAPGTAAHEDAEKTVTGAAAARAQAAAVRSVGSGNAGPVSTDCSGRGYEVTVTRSDGSKIEVHLDRSFRVMHGPRGPGSPPPAGGHAWGPRAPSGG